MTKQTDSSLIPRVTVDITSADTRKKFVSMCDLFKSNSEVIQMVFYTDKCVIANISKTKIVIHRGILRSDWFDKYETIGLKDGECLTTTMFSATFHKIISINMDQRLTIIYEYDADKTQINMTDIIANNMPVTIPEPECTSPSSQQTSPLPVPKKGKKTPKEPKAKKEPKQKNVPVKEFPRNYVVGNINVTLDLPAIPDDIFDVDIIFKSDQICSLIKEFGQIGKTLKIICNDDDVELMTEGDGDTQLTVKVNGEDLDEYLAVPGEITKSEYSLATLLNDCLHKGISPLIQFSILNHERMKVLYDLGNESTLEFHVAALQSTEDD